MRSGAPVIYQATLLHEDLVGHADFMRRVERPSALGDWSYEVIDTKLARIEEEFRCLRFRCESRD